MPARTCSVRSYTRSLPNAHVFEATHARLRAEVENRERIMSEMDADLSSIIEQAALEIAIEGLQGILRSEVTPLLMLGGPKG